MKRIKDLSAVYDELLSNQLSNPFEQYSYNEMIGEEEKAIKNVSIIQFIYILAEFLYLQCNTPKFSLIISLF